jgi:hypothetical protein
MNRPASNRMEEVVMPIPSKESPGHACPGCGAPVSSRAGAGASCAYCRSRASPAQAATSGEPRAGRATCGVCGRRMDSADFECLNCGKQLCADCHDIYYKCCRVCSARPQREREAVYREERRQREAVQCLEAAEEAAEQVGFGACAVLGACLLVLAGFVGYVFGGHREENAVCGVVVGVLPTIGVLILLGLVTVVRLAVDLGHRERPKLDGDPVDRACRDLSCIWGAFFPVLVVLSACLGACYMPSGVGFILGGVLGAIPALCLTVMARRVVRWLIAEQMDD